MKQFVSADALQQFLAIAQDYRNWLDTVDPDSCSPAAVADALKDLSANDLVTFKPGAQRPRYRVFKPNAEWQRNQRKMARLPMNGYRTGFLPNDDASPFTLCSLAYDLCDFYEQLSRINLDKPLEYLDYTNWSYTRVRIYACRDALLREAPGLNIDPFQRLDLKGRQVRFVTWSASSETHLTEDAEAVRGASTLCGGRLAYHRHTHQQWTCYWCAKCRALLDQPRTNPPWHRPR